MSNIQYMLTEDMLARALLVGHHAPGHGQTKTTRQRQAMARRYAESKCTWRKFDIDYAEHDQPKGLERLKVTVR